MKRSFYVILIVIAVIIFALIIINMLFFSKASTKLEPEKYKEVQFTRTYHIDYKLNYTDTTGKYGYIVVNQFQMDMPTVIKLTNEQLENIIVDNNYEFTFVGNANSNKDYNTISEIFQNFDIISINKTDKLGNDQIQDNIF